MVQHGFVKRKQLDIEDYDGEMSNCWLNVPGMISHAERYITAIQEQEINTRALQKSRTYKDNNAFHSKCRFCHQAKEDIFHLLASCGHLSSSLYLLSRHDEVAKVIFNEIIKEENSNAQHVNPRSEQVWKSEKMEMWWDSAVQSSPRTKHNKPDIVLWKKEEKTCKIIDICIPLDANVKSNEKTKRDRYMPLSVSLKRLYPDYSYSVIPIVLGATGLITKSLSANL